jgi:IstB-like ATP binding protein
VITPFIPLVEGWLRADLRIKDTVVHERLVAEYGLTGHSQRRRLGCDCLRPHQDRHPLSCRTRGRGAAASGGGRVRRPLRLRHRCAGRLFHPGLEARKIKDLATLEFVKAKSNVAPLGPPGVGKTMLAVALA